jgi:integrase
MVAAEGEKRDFHSFRHTVRTKLTEASIPENLIDDIFGHISQGSSIGKTVYSHTQLVPQKKEAIEKLVYPIDFAKIAIWERCRFMRRK